MTETRAGTLAVDVAIVGAGPAGLTAGYLLAKAGKTVAIIEKDPRYVGGLGRTIEQEGCRFGIGGHSFFSESAAVVELWNELLPGALLERPRRSRIYFEGKFYNYPLRVFEALGNLGPLRAAACIASFVKAAVLPRRKVRSFEDWAVNQFGERLYAIVVKAYAEKLWGTPCEELSAQWATQRFEGLSSWSAVASGIKRLLGLGARARGGRAVRPLLDTIRHPRRGSGMLWDAARDRIEAMGGIVLLGHAMDQLAADGEGGWRLSALGPQGKTVIAAAHAISSAPMRELAARLHPLPDATWNASKLKYRDFLTVALKVSSAGLFSDHSIYVHDGRVKVGRIQNFRSWSPELAPEDGTACVGLEYFCFEGDGLWSMSDADLVDMARRELDILGLVQADKVSGGTVVRQEKAYPIYDDEFAANVAALRHELETRHPTLHLVGRNGMHRCGDQDHAMMAAMLTAENILAGERKHDAWRLDGDADSQDCARTGPALPARETSSRGEGVAHGRIGRPGRKAA